ncbi:hypothetical protein CHU98_g1106 [Xylaria longipes]|nr:hypothetical protein CHU98_g1106 [Xylaria longipes]
MRFPTLPALLLLTSQSTMASAADPIVGPVKGSLVVVGGGTLSDSIYQEVITRAAGGPIVVIPTADGAPTYDQNAAGASSFRRLGASSVTVLHTYDPKVADTDVFVAPLLNASAVWFGGGRQWRLVDAYAGTKTEAAFRAVLDRGGVIGGSSPGASATLQLQLTRKDVSVWDTTAQNWIVPNPGGKYGVWIGQASDDLSVVCYTDTLACEDGAQGP